MKLRVKKTTTFVSLCFSVLAVFGLIFVLNASTDDALAQREGGRLIILHDRGKETAFITSKETLQEALVEQGITIDSEDAVEPSLDEKLVAPDYRVNIYRARPVTIIDGATRQKIITPYQSPERIAQDAGITLYPEDIASLSRSTDLIGDGAGLNLTIDRATVLSVDLYGKVTEVRTQGKTVAEFLKEKNIELGESGRVSVSLDTPITAGMQFRIWREGKQTITVDEAVAFETEQIKDADRLVGYKEVKTAGKDGKRTVTYEVTIQNGVEVVRTEIASIALEEAVKQVEIVGSKTPTLPYTGGGTKTEWLAASNIPEDSWGYADFMVSRESGWNPNAQNKSSGACGLAQALPCSKVGPNWSNPVVSLNWMHSYVIGRYGSWENAYNFWQRNHWY